MSQEQRPGDLFEVELTLTENQVHDILGGLAWGADYAEVEIDPDVAEEMRETRDVVVEQFNGQEAKYIGDSRNGGTDERR